jgi:PAS domain S-box-containing protein
VSIEHAPSLEGWRGLFWEAFRQSKNGMALLDDRRVVVELNGAWVQLLGYDRPSVIGRPVYQLRAQGTPASEREWRDALQQRQFTGVAELRRSDGSTVRVEFAGHPEVVTGKQLVLIVVLRADRRGGLRRVSGGRASSQLPLSNRELEVVKLIALGLSGPEIAAELQLAHNTVRTHIRNAMTKTESHSRAQLVAKMLAEATILQQAA